MFRVSKASVTRRRVVASRLGWAALGTCMAACPVAARAGTAPPSYFVTDLQAAAPANVSVGLFAINNGGEAVGSYGGYPAIYRNGTFQVIPTPNGYSGIATAISSNGLVAGNLDAPSGVHAFVYDGSATKDIGSLGLGPDTEATGINASGQVVGYSGHAFLYSGGTMTDLGTLGSTASIATAINDAGQVVGYDNLRVRSFLYDAGGMHDLGTLGGSGAEAAAINNSGQIVGSLDGVGGLIKQAFLDSNGTVQDLGVPSGFPLGGTTASFANGMNDAGEVVGAFGYSGTIQAFLYDNGTTYNLNDLVANADGIISDAFAINSAGVIVGTILTPTGESHAVLLTPAPAPAIAVPLPAGAWAGLATIGLVTLVAAARRRRSVART